LGAHRLARRRGAAPRPAPPTRRSASHAARGAFDMSGPDSRAIRGSQATTSLCTVQRQKHGGRSGRAGAGAHFAAAAALSGGSIAPSRRIVASAPSWPWVAAACAAVATSRSGSRSRASSPPPPLPSASAADPAPSVRSNGYLPSRSGCPNRWHSLVSCDHGDSTTSRFGSPADPAPSMAAAISTATVSTLPACVDGAARVSPSDYYAGNQRAN
jgi:hypothetical protein